MSDGNDDDRAKRLSRRRQRRRSDDTDSTDDTETTDVTDDTDESLPPITDRQHTTFYLSDALRTELTDARVSMEYELQREYGFEMEKNRHFRPLALYLGARKIKTMSAEEIADILDTTDVLDSTGLSEISDVGDE